VIVQFGKGCGVKANGIDIRTSQANRIIYHKDEDNIAMNLNEDFSDLITGAKVFLISGFNAMQSEALLSKRLESLARIMEKLPDDALIFYEDAGYYEPEFRQAIFRSLAGKECIVSLNEDELQEHLGRKLDFLNAFQIRDALEDLQSLVPESVIVVHTRYWALAYGDDAAKLSGALRGGVTMATTRFCYGDEFTAEDYSEVARLPANEEGTAFTDEVNRLLEDRICCLPVAHVDQSNATTIGLGDAFIGGFLCALSVRGMAEAASHREPQE
jgi:ADP-dependent phosphofructokinase/glucokinase